MGVIFGSPAERPAGPIPSLEQRVGHAAAILAAAGLILLLVTWTHLALIWVPSSFGAAAWEYAASTQTIDIFPLGVMGISLLSVAAIVRSWPGVALALAILCWLTSVVLVVVSALIVLDMPVAWQSVQQQFKTTVVKSGGKAIAFALLFVAYHIWLSVRLLRSRTAIRA